MRIINALALVCLISAAAQGVDLNTLVMPQSRLSTIKAALPLVADPKLAKIFSSPETLWYDETVMARSYQDSVGASSNDKWPDLVAGSEQVITGLHDRVKHRWQFPFSTTAGTDESTNLQVANFVLLPQVNGQVKTIAITQTIKNADRPEWMWTYPEGTVFGEVLFIKDGSSLLPCEVRTRTRQVTAWSMNVYRPFPRAIDLVKAIQEHRPDWSLSVSLRNLVRHLQDPHTLTSINLSGKA